MGGLLMWRHSRETNGKIIYPFISQHYLLLTFIDVLFYIQVTGGSAMDFELLKCTRGD